MNNAIFIALGASAIGLAVTAFCVFLAISNKKKAANKQAPNSADGEG